MNLDSARQLASRLEFVESTGSTNTDLMRASTDADAWPDLSVLCAAEQTEGKGRAGRQWESRAGDSLSVSILVRPQSVPSDRLGWLPILAGVAMTEAVSTFLPQSEVGFKWPNDVLVDDRKISGVLSEVSSDLSAVVIGAGLNLAQKQEQLPIAEATSLRLEGATVDFATALETYLREFQHLYKSFIEHSGDADKSSLRASAQERCLSIGRPVRAIMPDQTLLEGKAIGLDATGRLMISVDGEEQLHLIAAGDITHLRHG